MLSGYGVTYLLSSARCLVSAGDGVGDGSNAERGGSTPG